MEKTSKGAIHIFLLLVVVVIGVAGIGYYAFKNDQIKTTPQLSPTPTLFPDTPTPTSNPTADWETYNNTELGLSFKYPSGWKLSERKLPTRSVSIKLQSNDLDVAMEFPKEWPNDLPLETYNHGAEIIVSLTGFGVYDSFEDLVNSVTNNLSSHEVITHNKSKYLIGTQVKTKLYHVYEVHSTFDIKSQHKPAYLKITLISAPQDAEEYYQILLKMLSRLEFINNEAVAQINESVFSGGIWVYHVDIVDGKQILTVHNGVTSKQGVIVDMRMWTDDDELDNWQPYVEYPKILFDNKTDVSAQFKDSAGNLSPIFSDAVNPPFGPPPE